MATSDDWRTLMQAFADLQGRTNGTLRADHQAAGWGRSERKLLERLSDGDPTVQHYTPVRDQLEMAAATPRWYLPYAAEHHQAEFVSLAGRGAALMGSLGSHGWLIWLDQLLAEGIGDREHYYGRDGETLTLLLDACAASGQYCTLLALGHQPVPLPALAPEEVSASRRARVLAYQLEVEQATGERPTKAMIYRTAAVDRSEFGRWERNGPYRFPTGPAVASIERVLSEKPHLHMKKRS